MSVTVPPVPTVEGFFDAATHTITYLVADPETGAALIIDPVLDFDAAAARISTTSLEQVLARIAERGLTLERVLETHAHADHLTGADEIRRRTGAPIGIGSRITEVQKVFGVLFEAHDVTDEDAGRTEFRWETTVAAEAANNIHIGAGRSENEFVALREARDATLKVPALILPALQINIRAGAMPPAEPSGQRFLKTPLNAI